MSPVDLACGGVPGFVSGAEIDHRDGYIHFSTAVSLEKPPPGISRARMGSL
jgi:uncharacterized protein (DUF952 family)